MKVWISKGATDPNGFIFSVDGDRFAFNQDAFLYVHPVTGRERMVYGEGKDWHLTRDGAVKRVRWARARRIKALKTQLARMIALQTE